VGRLKTVVTNRLCKMFWSHIHRATEHNTAARINQLKPMRSDSLPLWCLDAILNAFTNLFYLTTILLQAVAWLAQSFRATSSFENTTQTFCYWDRHLSADR